MTTDTPLPRVGYVISNWLVKRQATSASGETVFLLACLGCGRSFNASISQIEKLGPCGACQPSNDTDSDKPVTRLPLHLRGWKELP